MIDTVVPYLVSRAFLDGMIDAGWGRIVSLSSAASLHTPGPLNSAYGTAKVALNQFTRHLAAELKETGVTANVIHPGDVKTAMWSDIRDKTGTIEGDDSNYDRWVEWVEETGGDPPEKAAKLVLDIIENLTNPSQNLLQGPFSVEAFLPNQIFCAADQHIIAHHSLMRLKDQMVFIACRCQLFLQCIDLVFRNCNGIAEAYALGFDLILFDMAL